MYFPTYKRMHVSLKKMALKSEKIEASIDQTYSMPPPEAWKATDNLMRQTIDLIEQRFPAIDVKKAKLRLDTQRKRQDIAPKFAE